jgi:hypothetical protein
VPHGIATRFQPPALILINDKIVGAWYIREQLAKRGFAPNLYMRVQTPLQAGGMLPLIPGLE